MSNDAPPKHISIRPLTIYDLDKVMQLESSCFSESERATLEKLEYRLQVCPELCSGLFIRKYIPKYQQFIDQSEQSEENIFDGGNNGGNSNGKSSYDLNDLPPSKSCIVEEKLIGHIIATKIHDEKISDRSMEIPELDKQWLPLSKPAENLLKGHVESSRIIGIHSIAIAKPYQGMKLSSLLIKDYLQKLNQQDFGDSVVLICHDYLVEFYEKFGFMNLGLSDCKFGGDDVKWYDMAHALVHADDDDDMY